MSSYTEERPELRDDIREAYRSLAEGDPGEEVPECLHTIERLKTALYRHFDCKGRLLYVGISLSAITRLSQHMHSADWADEIARVDIQWYGNRSDALDAEKEAIQTERPKHNIRHREGEKPSRCTVLTPADLAAIAMCREIGELKLLYSKEDLRKALHLSGPMIELLWSERKLGYVIIPAAGRKHPKIRTTGWQVIEFLESCNHIGASD